MSNKPIISTPYGVNNNYGLAERTANPTTVRVQRERPILFSAEMVRAILAGTKTQTRRLVKPQPGLGYEWTRVVRVGPWFHIEADKPEPVMHTVTCKQGEVGDRLRVKEHAWMWCEKVPNGKTKTGREKFKYVPLRSAQVIYCADHPEKPALDVVCEYRGYEWGWRKKLGRFLPSWASRITLEITGVRVERLNACSEFDALAEGIDTSTCRVTSQLEAHAAGRCCSVDYVDGYRKLWESINGAGSWALNPWVFVIEFRRVNT